MSSEIKVGLKLAGSYIDFEEASDQIGLKPSKTLILKNDYGVFPKYQWNVIAEYSQCESVDDKAQELFALISGHEERILEYSRRNKFETIIECNIRIHADRPLYELSRVSIKKIAMLDASFTMDIFDFRKCDSDGYLIEE